MTTPRIYRPSRRALMLGAGATLTLVPALSAARDTTPRTGEGPFYPVDWHGDVDNDLVRVEGRAAKALGRIVHVSGRLIGPDGAPVRDAMVEIWQADSNGHYHHPGDRPYGNPPDQGFQGHGRMRTGADGGYRFRTIRPVPYPGRTAPHIHFRVKRGGQELLTTQLFVQGDPGNAGDFVWEGLGEARSEVTVPFAPADRVEPGALAARFDIRLAQV